MPAASSPSAAAPSAVAAPTSGASARILPLDGIRGLAAMLVFVYHCTIMHPHGWAEEAFTHMTFLNGLSPLLFFVLSGFLITGILWKTREDPRYFVNFYARRALRIVPLYYAVIFLSLVILPAFFGSNPKVQSFGRIGDDGWMYWLFLANFSVGLSGAFRHGILDVTWSLAIEEQFYLVWPLVVYVCSKRTLIRACLGLILLGFLYRVLMVFVFEAHPITAYVITHGRVGALATGSLIALVWREPQLLAKLRPYAVWVAVLTAPFIWIFTGVERYVGIDFYAETGFKGGPWSRTFGDFGVLVGLASFMVLCLTAKPTDLFYRVIGGRFFTTLAKYSYGIFLFHTPIRALVRDTLFGPIDATSHPLFRWPMILGSQIPGQLMFYVLSMAATFPMAYLSYHLYEKHWLILKKFFPYRSRDTGPV